MGAYREARFPFASLAAIERAQSRRVRRMVAHAYATVPFYRRAMDELGLRLEDFRSAADLARLPLIDLAALNREPEAFRSSAHPAAQCVRLFSGGGSGTPHAVEHDVGGLIANAAHGERDRAIIAELIGRRVGYRETELAPPTSTAAGVRRAVGARTLIPARIRIERQELSLLDPPAENVRRINDFRPDVIRGFGSAVGLLFADLHASGVAFHRPTVVAFSSDALPFPARRLIEEDYGIPVFGAYQAIEALKVGFECEYHRGYHLNRDLYPVRIVDAAGREVAAGESGEIMVSNLVNRATVLLNYRLGDLGRLAAEPCPCGRSLPLLASLDGRSVEVYVLPSGRLVHPLALDLLELIDGDARQVQVVQEAPDWFRVAVVAARDVDRERLRTKLAAGLAEKLGEPVTIDVAFVDAIARTAGGKVRVHISKCRVSGTVGAGLVEDERADERTG